MIFLPTTKRTCAISRTTSARRCKFVFAERIEDVLAAAIPELTAGMTAPLLA